MTDSKSPFKAYANDYDEWFDSKRGSMLFSQELGCLQQAIDHVTVTGRWLEIGVGSGRFASALGVGEGVDPVLEMVNLAAARGIETYLATGEKLPFENEMFAGVLMVCSICFVEKPEDVFSECWRVLKESGRLVIGFIPANSLWGHYHSQRGKQRHRFYSSANFYSVEDIKSMAIQAKFVFESRQSCDLVPPKELSDDEAGNKNCCLDKSFVVLTFTKKTCVGETQVLED